MANIQSISHKKSSVIENGAPKLPTAAQLELGELAINFADGYETLSIKNNNNEIVTFTNDEYWINKERVIAHALTDLDEKISNISVELSDDYETSTDSGSDLDLQPGDSLDVLAGKLEKSIEDSQLVTAAAITDINNRLNNSIQGIEVNGVPVTPDENNIVDITIPPGVLPTDYEMSEDTNADLLLEAGDTYVEAFGKLEKAILDNELVTSEALNELNASLSTTIQPSELKTINNTSLVGSGDITIASLPSVTAADNGKTLMVVNGVWTLVSPSTIYVGTGTPSSQQGSDGDIYLQTS